MPLATLQKHFGFDSFRPGQEEVIQALLAGRSALALFPTGAGKSLCYQLPALMREGTALIISPLIALMKDQVDVLKARGIPAARLDSSLTKEETLAVYDQLRSGKLKLLYIAPERLMSETFMERLTRIKVSLLAVDEAHCISEWGHNFRPEYLRLAKVARQHGLHPVLALTATATPSVARDICRSFDIGAEDHVQTSFHRSNLHLRVIPVSAGQRQDALTARLKNPKVYPAIVYVTQQETAARVAAHLRGQGLRAGHYHAGMKDDERHACQEDFMAGGIDIMVATIAFGMGIDKDNIRGVFHFNMPRSLENYQQETGRAGRDGQPSLCEIYACGDDMTVLENFVFGDTPSEGAVRQLMRRLFSQGDEFDFSLYDWSGETDIRPIVIETILTYLELQEAVLPVGTFYSSFALEFFKSQSAILSEHTAARQQFLRALFQAGKMGSKLLTIEADDVAAKIGESRERILKAVNWLEETGAVKARPSGVRQRYRLGPQAPAKSPEAWADELSQRFLGHEKHEIERMKNTVAFAEHHGCLTQFLLAYFGEAMEPCGHCHPCQHPSEEPRLLPRQPAQRLSEADLSLIREVLRENHPALREPRQLARFLCGIASPATTRQKLKKHPAFGKVGHVPFQEVLAGIAEHG